MKYLALLLLLCGVPVLAQPVPVSPFEAAMQEGDIADAAGQQIRALQAYTRAVSEAERGGDHPEWLIRSLLKCADLTARAGNEGRDEQARELLARALIVAEKAYGADDFRLVEPLTVLGWQCQRVKDTAQAEAHLTRALAISEKTLPPDSPQLADARFALGGFYWAQHDFPQAIAYYRQALAAFDRAYGVEHQRTRLARLNLAKCLLYDKQIAEAETQCQALIDVLARVEAGGWEHSEALALQAQVYIAQQQYAKAEPLELQVFTYAEKLMGKENMGMSNYLQRMVQFYQDASQPEKAEPYLQRLISLMGKPTTPEPALAKIHEQYALLLVALQRPREAKDEYRAAYDICERWFSRNTRSNLDTGEMMIPLFYHDEATECQQLLTRYAAFMLEQHENAEAERLTNRAAEVEKLLASSKAMYQRNGPEIR